MVAGDLTALTVTTPHFSTHYPRPTPSFWILILKIQTVRTPQQDSTIFSFLRPCLNFKDCQQDVTIIISLPVSWISRSDYQDAQQDIILSIFGFIFSFIFSLQ